MKKNIILFLILGIGINNAFSGDDVLLKIHDREITKDEFLRIYNKNNNSNTVDNKSIDEYLDLFINFKLKVIEAEELGYDTLASFLSEFEQYRKQLVKPYLIDKDAEKYLVKQAYERKLYEVDASHILIRVSERASVEDTVRAYEKIMNIRQRILDGEEFGDVAMETSEDESARQNYGRLGYFTVFSMVYPFECGAYNTPVGEVSMPVRSRFGYHIIKVHDKRKSKGEVKVAHIMKMMPSMTTQEYRDSVKILIDKIYEKLQNGEDFAELAKELSDDKQSGNNGGELPWLTSHERRIPTEFVDTCFNIKQIGAYTQPFVTKFGWHIVKLLDKKAMPGFEEVKEDLTEKVKKDPRRSVISEKKAVEKLKKEYDFNEEKENLDYFKTIVDNDIFTGEWSADRCSSDEVIFVLEEQQYTQKDFANYLANTQKKTTPYDVSIYLTQQYQEFVKQSVLEYEESMLDEKYPEYRNLVQEYHDGILLFNLTDELVWSRAVKDSLGLRDFYDKNKENYKWDKRARVTIYSSDDEDKMKALRKMLKKSDIKNNEAVQMLCDTINPRCINFENGLYLKGENELVDKTKWKIGVSKINEKDGTYKLVRVNEIVPEQLKEFDEATGLITSVYQNYLDKQWIAELREKYKIVINEDVLTSVKKNN